MPALDDPRQEQFCQLIAEQYGIKGKKKTDKQCAIEAGYSEKTAEVTASKLLSKVKYKQRIDEIKAENAEKAGIKVSDELQKLQDFFVSVMENTNERMNNRLKAGELYGKTIGAFTEKREISGKDGGAITFRWDDG